MPERQVIKGIDINVRRASGRHCRADGRRPHRIRMSLFGVCISAELSAQGQPVDVLLS